MFVYVNCLVISQCVRVYTIGIFIGPIYVYIYIHVGRSGLYDMSSEGRKGVPYNHSYIYIYISILWEPISIPS